MLYCIVFVLHGRNPVGVFLVERERGIGVVVGMVLRLKDVLGLGGVG